MRIKGRQAQLDGDKAAGFFARLCQLKCDVIGAAGSRYIHRVLYELDKCDLYLYEFVSNCIPA